MKKKKLTVYKHMSVIIICSISCIGCNRTESSRRRFFHIPTKEIFHYKKTRAWRIFRGLLKMETFIVIKLIIKSCKFLWLTSEKK